MYQRAIVLTLILAIIIPHVQTSESRIILSEQDDKNTNEIIEDLAKAYDRQRDAKKKFQEDLLNKEDEEKMSAIGLWFFKNKQAIIAVLLISVGFVLFSLVTYKVFNINQDIIKQKAEITNYAQKLEEIIQGTDKLVFATWKDQREGIKFVDNPAYNKKVEKDLSKAQRILSEIEKVEEDIKKKHQEITKLREKEIFYVEEVEDLEKELEQGKTEVLDEGAALGFAETVLREFK